MKAFILSIHPLVGFTLVIVLCHGAMWTIAYLLEDRALVWSQQYFAFVYGDILLAVAVAFSLWANQRIGLPPGDHWLQPRWVNLVALFAVAAFGVWRWAFNDYPNYSTGQMMSPTKLYHDLLFVLVGYLLFLVVAPLVGRSWWVVVPLALLAGWAALGIVYDARAAWKAQYAHIDYEWAPKYWSEQHLDPILRR